MKDTVRLSFNVPVQEHIVIKTECVTARIPMKDFLHELVLLGLKEYKKKKHQEKLKESLQRAQEGQDGEKQDTNKEEELENLVEERE